MPEYQNDFAEWPKPDASWMADITIAVPYEVEINHYIAQERLHGIIDNLRERLAESNDACAHKDYEISRLRGEVSRLLGIIERLGVEVEGEEDGHLCFDIGR